MSKSKMSVVKRDSKPVATPVSMDAETAKALKAQYDVVVESEKSCFRERVKFGVMLIEWERFLGESRGGAGGGSDAGLKGWLAKNCPEIGYNAALGYKTMAARALKMLGGGAMATAALLGNAEVRQPDGEVIDVTPDLEEKCEKFFAAVDSRRKLEQAWFDFCGGKEQGAAKKVEARPLPTLSRKEAAKATWNIFMQKATAHSLKDAIPLLGEKETQVCHDDLRDLVALLKRHLEEF